MISRTSLLPFAVTLLLSAALSTVHAADLPSFDVISVKPNNSTDGATNTNVPLGPGDIYVTNGGYFRASGFPLITYIDFAYRIIGNDLQAVLAQLPGWVTTDRFDIQAKTDGDPKKDTKDQMRLMMRSLLAERFKLATHYETRQVPAFALTLQKPGKMGPQLRAHPADVACTTVLSPNGAVFASTGDPGGAVAGGYPAQCGGLLPLSSPNGRIRGGASNVTMAFIGNQLAAAGNLGRPVVDQTGLSGTFDFVFEWVPEVNSGLPPGPGGAPDFQPDPAGPSFLDALKDQLGLRLESQKGPSEFLVIDHVEHPTGN